MIHTTPHSLNTSTPPPWSNLSLKAACMFWAAPTVRAFLAEPGLPTVWSSPSFPAAKTGRKSGFSWTNWGGGGEWENFEKKKKSPKSTLSADNARGFTTKQIPDHLFLQHLMGEYNWKIYEIKNAQNQLCWLTHEAKGHRKDEYWRKFKGKGAVSHINSKPLGFHLDSKKIGKISIVIQDLSRNSVFFEPK